MGNATREKGGRHQPVLAREVIDRLVVKPDGCYIDGTAGSGGHTLALLRATAPAGRVLAIDRDAAAVERVWSRIAGYEDRCEIIQGNFADIDWIARTVDIAQADGILLDLGVSSEQLDQPARGFSFEGDGPLDMRMDRYQAWTAEDLVNSWPEDDLAGILHRFGDEKKAGQIARAIVRERDRRRISRTDELSRIVTHAVGGRRGRIHPATRAFQALRIAVNDELKNLERGLKAGLRLLAPGGRMAVLAFHSLEDRLVKQFCARHAGRWESLQQGGEAWHGDEPRVTRVTRKPVTASETERRVNPRARSAKLRVIERCGPADGAGGAT